VLVTNTCIKLETGNPKRNLGQREKRRLYCELLLNYFVIPDHYPSGRAFRYEIRCYFFDEAIYYEFNPCKVKLAKNNQKYEMQTTGHNPKAH